jgi:S-DNA-T family DNA segregation ATPase FtsK/SpoIIIE
MAKKRKKKVSSISKKRTLKVSDNTRLIIGSIFIFISLILLLSETSFFFHWKFDQSNLDLTLTGKPAKNLIGKIGANIGHFFVYKGFGFASLLLPIMVFYTGIYYILKKSFYKILKIWVWGMIGMYLGSFLTAMIYPSNYLYSGLYGRQISFYSNRLLGYIGSWLLVLLLIFSALIFKSGIDYEKIKATWNKWFNRKKSSYNNDQEELSTEELIPVKDIGIMENDELPEEIETEINIPVDEQISDHNDLENNEKSVPKKAKIDDMHVEIAEEEEIVQKAENLVNQFGSFDPKLELSQYQYPTFDLLKDYGSVDITYNEKELKRNKDKIVKTLLDFKIKISKIDVVVGPSVTLYEIIPEAGIRISKIKNLEDDIAMSLSALGIRIIAPMPGKGTIGIEVPNKIRKIVPMRSVLQSKRFQEAEMDLPIAIGKNISNQTYVFDLAKMPHLLVAGATGQGKSVGINAIITSLLYKKHPAELKFVLVDPKKVELTLYNKIERHFLAKLPDEEEAIITDTSKVVKTLNSLTKEMDMRYDLLKKAMVRNIKEYNEKFKKRLLNPEQGHRYLPYIVLVIDEFADLMITAGKEIEVPIARIAQLARAVGIHLIVATQRPSVNVITGMIKANFPARIAFMVSSKIDSRTILDASGAEQLIGKGDMLISTGNDLVRLQCAFIDTPEVENLTTFIGSQRAYPTAFPLPEVEDEGNGTGFDNDIDERDDKFKEAAYLVVTHQQGSASLLQRKLKLGYNRAGRLIDQLEAAGIVGPFEGSKARKVLIPDVYALDEFFNKESNT